MSLTRHELARAASGTRGLPSGREAGRLAEQGFPRQPSVRSLVSRWLSLVLVLGAVFWGSWAGFDTPLLRWSAALTGLYLVLALSELVPPFVPTLVLLPLVAAILGADDSRF